MIYPIEYIENAELDDVTYYTIQVWADKTKQGKTLNEAFSDKTEAEEEMTRQIRLCEYEMIVLREENVIKRRSYCEISMSSPIASYEKKERELIW